MSMKLNEFMYDKTLIDSLTTADLQLRLRYIYVATAHYELAFIQPVRHNVLLFYSHFLAHSQYICSDVLDDCHRSIFSGVCC